MATLDVCINKIGCYCCCCCEQYTYGTAKIPITHICTYFDVWKKYGVVDSSKLPLIAYDVPKYYSQRYDTDSMSVFNNTRDRERARESERERG